MPNYKKMYNILFNQMTNAIEQLKDAQKKTEEMYIKSSAVLPKIIISKEKNPPFSPRLRPRLPTLILLSPMKGRMENAPAVPRGKCPGRGC